MYTRRLKQNKQKRLKALQQWKIQIKLLVFRDRAVSKGVHDHYLAKIKISIFTEPSLYINLKIVVTIWKVVKS